MEENITKEEARDRELFDKIEEIYNSKNKEGKPTGKNFITHLLRSYFPIGKAMKVFDIPETPMKCAITGQKLMALGEILVAMQDNDGQYMKDMMKSMQYAFDPENKEEVEHPLKKLANGRVLAIVGQNTDKYLCQEGYQALYNWYVHKILSGDGHITWVMKDVQKGMYISAIRERLPESEDQKKIDHLEKLAKKPKKSGMSLGDMSVLQELQEKLKKQEGNA